MYYFFILKFIEQIYNFNCVFCLTVCIVRIHFLGTLLLSGGGADLIGSMNEPIKMREQIKMSERNLNVLINAKDFSL